MEFLKKAEVLGQNSIELKAITYNNMACYYRRIGKLQTALTYLQQALMLENRIERSQTVADTHLNICAVYSQLGNKLILNNIKQLLAFNELGKHDLAKEHIIISIILLQEEFLAIWLPKKNEKSEVASQREEKESGEVDATKNVQDRIAVLAIAYHNLGVEYEFLKKVIIKTSFSKCLFN